MQTTHEQAIEAAVNYWAGFLEKGPTMNKSGDGMIDLMMTLVQHTTNVDPDTEQVASFKEALGAHIRSLFDRNVSWITLDVDYGPDMNLSNALRAAGIKSSPFPMKTIMWVKPNEVSVAQGYRAESRVLWSAKTEGK